MGPDAKANDAEPMAKVTRQEQTPYVFGTVVDSKCSNVFPSRFRSSEFSCVVVEVVGERRVRRGKPASQPASKQAASRRTTRLLVLADGHKMCACAAFQATCGWTFPEKGFAGGVEELLTTTDENREQRRYMGFSGLVWFGFLFFFFLWTPAGGEVVHYIFSEGRT